ncbi:hypothetical protein BKA70DRAFT_1241887 [Coprinopsis sp. MPI-PUGE-AT-0042]|nr:hypothetical protein BKA70DRAFT_1241887 [Coprinopsis sp. MPI-PUGE-AT-0042]
MWHIAELEVALKDTEESLEIEMAELQQEREARKKKEAAGTHWKRLMVVEPRERGTLQPRLIFSPPKEDRGQSNELPEQATAGGGDRNLQQPDVSLPPKRRRNRTEQPYPLLPARAPTDGTSVWYPQQSQKGGLREPSSNLPSASSTTSTKRPSKPPCRTAELKSVETQLVLALGGKMAQTLRALDSDSTRKPDTPLFRSQSILVSHIGPTGSPTLRTPSSEVITTSFKSSMVVS